MDVDAVLPAAASDQENDQVTMQAVAALEAEVTGFQKLGPSVREKIQFFVKGEGGTQVCRGSPGQSLSSVLLVSPETHVCCNGKVLDITSSTEDLGLLPDCVIGLCVRLRGGGPQDVAGQWQCATCGAPRCWPTATSCCWQWFSPGVFLCASRFSPVVL